MFAHRLTAGVEGLLIVRRRGRFRLQAMESTQSDRPLRKEQRFSVTDSRSYPQLVTGK
jgi:hypothetical protein